MLRDDTSEPEEISSRLTLRLKCSAKFASFVDEFQRHDMPHTEKNDSFEDWALPEVATNYRHLRRDKRVTDVIETLKRRGMSDWDIEILFRNVASIPRDWRSDNETWKQAERRRNRLAKTLRALAKELVADPDLGGLGFEIDRLIYANSSEYLGGAQSLAQILETAVSFLEPGDKPLIQMADGKTLTPREYEGRFRPPRSMPRKSYVLFAIFRLLNPSFEPSGKPAPDVDARPDSVSAA